jgi:ribosomal protein S18 acetylase RimI-like enzyme
MEITNSSFEDLKQIKGLYSHAVNLQKKYYAAEWPTFSDDFILEEIEEKKNWKILVNNQIACVWSTTFSDPMIWLQRNNDPSVYIHRIATSPEFRGRYLVKEIVKWGKLYAKSNKKEYIRMDTVGNNSSLINYYQQCGFHFLGLFQLIDTAGLPAHYKNATVSLFEIFLGDEK